jgi:hypothetical protein
MFVAAPVTSFAQTDEIQVYDAAIANRGKLNLMIHSNFTPDGLKTPAFPGGIESNKAFVGVAEWAYGVADWFEQGLYLPLYSYSQNDGMTYNGFKVRELFVKPHAEDHTFFYGVNFEFSVNQKQWDTRHYTSEVRPIIGWHLKPEDGSHWKPVDIIINPIMDTSYVGGLKSLDFAPAIELPTISPTSGRWLQKSMPTTGSSAESIRQTTSSIKYGPSWIGSQISGSVSKPV